MCGDLADDTADSGRAHLLNHLYTLHKANAGGVLCSLRASAMHA